MHYVTDLKDIGNDKDLLIIGGGFSAGDFDYEKIKDMTTLALNDSLYFDDGYTIIEPDYMMYNDLNMIKVIKEMIFPDKTKVIGLNNAYWPDVDYCFRKLDIAPARDGHNLAVKAILLAQKVFSFSRIFLTGIDFYTKTVNGKVTSHLHGEKIGVGQKYVDDRHYNTHLKNLDKRVDEFNVIEDRNNIFNCNPDSRLTIFSFLKPY